MRVALVAPLVSPVSDPPLGGAQALLADLAQGLRQRGHEITLYARAGSTVEGVSLRAVPVEIDPIAPYRVGGNLYDEQAFRAYEYLFRQVSRHEAEHDIVHCHAFDAPAFSLASARLRLPVIHTLHLPATDALVNEAIDAVMGGRSPPALTTVSRACALGYARHGVSVVRNGVPVERIPFGAEHDEFLLCVGRISPEKGQHVAIRVARRLRRRLILVGGCYDERYFAEQVAPQLAPDVVYLGVRPRAEVWRLMGRAAALLAPLQWDEPFGLMLAESMTAGTPVAAYARGAAPELIVPGVGGALAAPGDEAALCEAASQATQIDRVACRRLALGCFSVERMLDGYEEIYRRPRFTT